MATRTRYTGPRTPRRQKVWAYKRDGGKFLSTNTIEVVIDLLEDYKSDLGVSFLQGLTVMRVNGTIALINSAGASAVDPWEFIWGIAWVRNVIATAGVGDAQIPDPGELGTRETEWLQRGLLRGTSTIGALTRYADQNQLLSFIKLDITQMRKQPTVDHQLVLIARNTAATTVSAGIDYDLQTMLALP